MCYQKDNEGSYQKRKENEGNNREENNDSWAIGTHVINTQ
jgi:hypothetical protein